MTTTSCRMAWSLAESCTSSPAPEATLWMWTLAYACHEDRRPTRCYEPTREAAIEAVGTRAGGGADPSVSGRPPGSAGVAVEA
jgi:hypothetical protein